MNPKDFPNGAQNIGAADIETTPTLTDLIETFDVTRTNERKAIALHNVLAGAGVVRQVRRRCTIAEINAGVTILAAVPGYKYRLVDAAAIAYGGNVGGTTGVDLTGTLSTARKLVAFKTAGLTQSTLLRAGTATNGVLLADGASFTANDANTAITAIKDGSDLTTATGVDILVSFVLDKA